MCVVLYLNKKKIYKNILDDYLNDSEEKQKVIIIIVNESRIIEKLYIRFEEKI